MPQIQHGHLARPTTIAFGRTNLLLCPIHAKASRTHRHVRVESGWCDVCRGVVPE
jgi:hypothetical protein